MQMMLGKFDKEQLLLMPMMLASSGGATAKRESTRCR